MDGNIQLTFYEIAPAPAAPALKVKIEKIPVGPRITMIRELPTSEQPVSRLQHYGAGALSTVELLAIILGSRQPRRPRRPARRQRTPLRPGATAVGATRRRERHRPHPRRPPQGHLRDRPPAASRHAGGEAEDQVSRRRCQPADDGNDGPGAGTPQGRHPGHAEPRPESPHRLHRLTEHRRRASMRTLPRGHPPQRRRDHRAAQPSQRSTRPLRRRRLRHTPDRGGRQGARHRLPRPPGRRRQPLGFSLKERGLGF